MDTTDQQIIGVKEFVGVLRETLQFAFPAVTVEGEVTGYKQWNQYLYFSIKEEEAVLDCFMIAATLKVPIEDGMKIRVTGNPSFTKKGRFSFTVRQVTLAGEGELKRAFELLKAKLDGEGLFDPARKRELPRFPQTIGLITSGTSAAYADFIKILGQRWGGVNVQLADVQVQGNAAPDQIVGAITHFNQLATPPDVLVVIRGGGSLEDLLAFNTEPVTRAIAGSRTPTIVGVGHEVDISLADFAADVRAATPTDAARLVVPDRAQMAQEIEHHARTLDHRLRTSITSYHGRIQQQVTILERFIRVPQAQLSLLEHRLRTAQAQLLTRSRQRLDQTARLLNSFDPAATLKRGYAIVRTGGTVVRRASQAPAGTPLMIQLAAETLTAKVDDER